MLPALAQDSNILMPVSEIEQRLKYEPFEIFKLQGSRYESDLTKRVILKWPNNVYLQAKWKRAAPGGWADNNEPRYEIAAYQLQKLFLEPEEYVVPPTVGKCLPVSQYKMIEPGVDPTFKNTSSVYFVLQYWLEQVSPDEIFNKDRFDEDPRYARHLANMNILSYLIEHKDSNVGNFLISTDPENPRVFAVDNSLAFGSAESNRGTRWRKIRVNRLPQSTIDKLRKISRENLHATLGIVEQYEIREYGRLVPIPPTENLNPDKGVRTSDKVIQFGLTAYEIDQVYDRLQNLLEGVDSGKYETF
ncbi:hypothetical protein GWN15_18870 [candidate division KSB1 bacterium]|nr:hypothetical protein [candidate division KSB1 bacterium]